MNYHYVFSHGKSMYIFLQINISLLTNASGPCGKKNSILSTNTQFYNVRYASNATSHAHGTHAPLLGRGALPVKACGCVVAVANWNREIVEVTFTCPVAVAVAIAVTLTVVLAFWSPVSHINALHSSNPIHKDRGGNITYHTDLTRRNSPPPVPQS